MSTLRVPITGDDLITIGERVNDIEFKLREFVTEDATSLIHGVDDVVVQVLYPGSDSLVVGEVRWHADGWFGFYPYAVSE